MDTGNLEGGQKSLQRERERENYGNRDPLLEGGGQKADRPILPPAKVTPDKPGFLRALAR